MVQEGIDGEFTAIHQVEHTFGEANRLHNLEDALHEDGVFVDFLFLDLDELVAGAPTHDLLDRLVASFENGVRDATRIEPDRAA